MTGDPLRFFTATTLVTFRAVAARIIPSSTDSPGADGDLAIAITDRALSERPERDRRLLATFLRVVELLPILRYGRRFSKLTPARQDAVLRFFERTSLVPKLRQGFFGLKTFALMGYYGSPGTWPELGYPGPRMDAPYYQLRRKDGGAP